MVTPGIDPLRELLQQSARIFFLATPGRPSAPEAVVKVLLSAYACAEGQGSEPEVGFQVLLAALREHDVWVLTQPQMASDVRRSLRDRPGSSRARVIAVSPAAPAQAAGIRALAHAQWRHDQWQRAAADVARTLDAEVDFDLVHHVTLAAYWMRCGGAAVGKPVVWGPVGGGVEPPWRLLPVLGLRGACEAAVRTAVRRAVARLPSAQTAPRRASIAWAQNEETLRRLSRASCPVEVLSNALSIGPLHPRVPPGERRRDVAVVGRVVPWKGVALAVRALAHLAPDVPLRVYGATNDAELRRLRRLADAAGVSHRVDFMGRLPRHELLGAVATSGVLLHPALHDEAALGVAEALTLGTPVVALAHGGPAQTTRYWPAGCSSLVEPSWPAATAADLGAAARRFLDRPTPVAVRPTAPTTDLASCVLGAYASVLAAKREREPACAESPSTMPAGSRNWAV